MKTRLGNIELLRFIFALCIMFHHAMLENFPMKRGALSVEFFFLLSGVFLGRTIKKKKPVNNFQEIMLEDFSYVKRRVYGIFPYFIVSTIIGFFIIAYIYSLPINTEYIFELINDFLFLQSFGMPSISATGIVWYLSSMFFTLYVLYPIARRHYALFTYYIAPIMAILCIGTLIHTYGTLNVPNEYLFGLICTGFMRSFSMISLGFLCNEFGERISNSLPNNTSLCLTIVECSLYFFIIWYMYIWDSNLGKFDELVVFSMFFALSITLSNKSRLHRVTDNSLSRFLGRFSIPLFLSHFYWVQNISKIITKLNISAKVNTGYIGIMMSFFTAGIVMLIGNVLQRHWHKHFNTKQ